MNELMELVHNETIDLSETLRFTLPATSLKAYLVAPDYVVTLNGRRFTITEVEENRSGPLTTVSAEAEALWYRLGDQTYVGSIVLLSATPDEGLVEILAGSGWTTGPDSSTSTSTYSFEDQDKSRLELLRSWAKATDTAIRFDTVNKTVELLDDRGIDRGLAFRYRRNVQTVRRRIRPPEVTVLYPYGLDGLTIAGLNGTEYVEDFSYYTGLGLSLEEARSLHTRSVVWSDGDFATDTLLLAAANTRLAKLAQPTVTYELDVVDISTITGIGEDVSIGDTVRVQDPDFATDLRTTVVRIERHPNEPIKDRVELASAVPIYDDGSRSTRPASADEWRQFVGPVSANFLIRNDGTYTVARIPLQFREGGRGNFHVDLWATGVGAGTMEVEIYEAESGLPVFNSPYSVAYTDGELVNVSAEWASEELSGQYDWRIRVSTTASGGPDPTKGVDFELQDTYELDFWILAQGAVLQSPTSPNSATFEYTGAVQYWTVPDNVTGPVTITTRAAAGYGSRGGAGGNVVATFATVVPGTVYDVYVGGGTAGWPNGGAGGLGAPAGTGGGAGGGSSYVTTSGASIASALIVAPGGGGGAENDGGVGGFFVGVGGVGGSSGDPGGGATQYTGGALGTGSDDGEAGSFGQGGAGGPGTASLGSGGGGGGGGWYGGGGGGGNGSVHGTGNGGGGGGTGWVSAAGSDITVSDGYSSDTDGQIVIAWGE